MPLFHYAFIVNDISSTREFYVNLMECEEGRSTDHWIDFNFFGHQLSAHIGTSSSESQSHGMVDNVKVPIPHFGCIVDNLSFENLSKRLQASETTFLIDPCTRYKGKPGEQKTMFFLDPSGNAIEIKSFKNSEEIFQS